MTDITQAAWQAVQAGMQEGNAEAFMHELQRGGVMLIASPTNPKTSSKAVQASELIELAEQNPLVAAIVRVAARHRGFEAEANAISKTALLSTFWEYGSDDNGTYRFKDGSEMDSTGSVPLALYE